MSPDSTPLQLQAARLYESARALGASVGDASTSWDETSALVGRLQLVCFALTEVVERLPGEPRAPHAEVGARTTTNATDKTRGGEAVTTQCREHRNRDAFEVHARIAAGHLLLAGEHLTMAFNAAFHLADSPKYSRR